MGAPVVVLVDMRGLPLPLVRKVPLTHPDGRKSIGLAIRNGGLENVERINGNTCCGEPGLRPRLGLCEKCRIISAYHKSSLMMHSVPCTSVPRLLRQLFAYVIACLTSPPPQRLCLMEASPAVGCFGTLCKRPALPTYLFTPREPYFLQQPWKKRLSRFSPTFRESSRRQGLVNVSEDRIRQAPPPDRI